MRSWSTSASWCADAPSDRGQLLAYVQSAWLLIADAPNPAAWATAFLEARRMVGVAGVRLAVERN
jgi:hypothetical protein